MNYIPKEPIELTSEQLAQITYLEEFKNRGNMKLNTKIVYQLWYSFFGVRKAPNGCGSCMRTDLYNFITQYNELNNVGLIKVKSEEVKKEEE